MTSMVVKGPGIKLLILTTWVSLGKLFNLPQFPHFSMQDNRVAMKVKYSFGIDSGIEV